MNNEMQQTRNIKDVFTENENRFFNTNTHRMQSSIAPTCETEKGRAIERNSTPNIFLAQNKGKGPPGRQRSPVDFSPDRVQNPVRDITNSSIHSLTSTFGWRNFHPNNFETTTDKKYDDYKFYKFYFIQLLNSITMKKQLFILILAVFASTSLSFGQVKYKDYVDVAGCVTAKSLVCAGTSTTPELNPKPGVTYTYEVATVPTTVQSVLWFVTDASQVIDNSGAAPVLTSTRDVATGAGSYILSAPAAVYNVTTNTAMSIDISWKNFDGNTKEVLLVAYVTGASGCSDNIQVWRIKPVFNFTLDLASMQDDGTLGTTAAPAHECVSPVESAKYVSGSNELQMNYGKNYAFFSINAANFVGSWMPDLKATATYGTIGSVTWATPTDAVKATGGVWNATTVAVPASAAATGGVVGTAGECIIVRVEVVNGKNEGLADNTVKLTVDGVMFDPVANNYTNTTLKDMDEPASGSGACVNNITDEANYIINARPDINEVKPAPVTFVPKN